MKLAEWWTGRARRETIRVGLIDRQGLAVIDLRIWHVGANGCMRPGQGFSAPVDHLPRIAKAMTKAHARAVTLGLLPDGGGGAQ